MSLLSTDTLTINQTIEHQPKKTLSEHLTLSTYNPLSLPAHV